MCRRINAPCCQDCERPFYDLDDAGLCRHCAAVTEEAMEATIRQQLANAPLWFWREAVLQGLPYAVPEWAAKRMANEQRRGRGRPAGAVTNAVACEHCRCIYETANPKSRFCGDACRAAASRQRQREAVSHA